MKKILVMALMAIAATGAAFAQSPSLATLSHEGTLTTFYGAEGLARAHTAAVAGDVITLSSGLFTATDITKAVSIRGVGMLDDVTAGATPSVIAGNFKVSIANSSEKSLTMEGVYCSNQLAYDGELENARFSKCRINIVTSETDAARLINATFVHCYITGRFDLRTNSNSQLYNCVVTNPNSYHENTANFMMVNCVICCTYSSTGSNAVANSPSFIKSSVLENCYIYSKYSTNTSYNLGGSLLPITTQVTNCISNYKAGDYNIFGNSTNTTNKIVTTDNVFKTWRGGGSDSDTFELTDYAASTYLGADGTQIGIYGGILPFDKRPAYARFTKVEIPAQATDGKLPVKVEFATE